MAPELHFRKRSHLCCVQQLNINLLLSMMYCPCNSETIKACFVYNIYIFEAVLHTCTSRPCGNLPREMSLQNSCISENLNFAKHRERFVFKIGVEKSAAARTIPLSVRWGRAKHGLHTFAQDVVTTVVVVKFS